MKHNFSKSRAAVAAALLIAASVPLSTQSALACSPEIMIDAKTDVALPQADLKAALAEIENSIEMADSSS